MTPLVSIVVTCFNQANYIERSVKSVLSQTFTDLECIIVDDGSTDNTQEVVQCLLNLDSRVSYHYKENGGVSSSRNFGFKQAKGEWIQFLDGDDWIHEDKVRFQLSYIKENRRENTVFYTDYERVFIDEKSNITEKLENIVGSLTKAELIQRLLVPDFLADSPFPLLQQCLLMHRSVFQNKIFDERLKALQDRDFTLDLLLAGVTFIYTPMIGAFYTKHQFNRTNNWSYMKDYYIIFYETACGKHPEIIPICQQGIIFLIKEAIRDKEKDNFDRLAKLVVFPLYLFESKLKINNKFILYLFYLCRLFLPNKLLYEEFRGPRSHKIIYFCQKIISWLQINTQNYIGN